MNYICLAAGKGSRLGNLGSYLQKAMYPVGTRPFVEYTVMNILKSAKPKSDRIIFVVGHQGDQVRTYFGKEVDGLRVSYVEQKEPLGTAHAVYTAYQRLEFKDPAIIWLGDSYFAAATLSKIRAADGEAVLTVKECLKSRGDHVPGNKNIVVQLDGKKVVRCWQGTGNYYDIGLWKIAPSVIADSLNNKSDEYRMLLNLQRQIDNGLEARAVEADEWIHLGGTEPTVEENLYQVIGTMQHRTVG